MVANDDEAPRTLVIDAKPAPGDASSGSGSGMAPIVVPVLVAGLLAQYVSLRAAAAALVVGIVLFVVRRRPDLGRFVLHVESGVVVVKRERNSDIVARVALAELDDVGLDKEAHDATGRGGASVERVKLALRRAASAEPVLFPEARITPLEGQEWQGKVRVFLRKHGWVPIDERS